MHSSTPTYEELAGLWTRMHHLGHLQNIASWDHAANMPPKGNEARAAAMAEMAALLHRMARSRARQKKPVPQIWLTLNPEERRTLRSLLARPTTGYLMKPVRRSTLVRQLTERDSQHMADQTAQLRQFAKSVRKTRKLRLLLV